MATATASVASMTKLIQAASSDETIKRSGQRPVAEPYLTIHTQGRWCCDGFCRPRITEAVLSDGSRRASPSRKSVLMVDHTAWRNDFPLGAGGKALKEDNGRTSR